MTTFPSIESYIESFPNTLPSIKGEPTFEALNTARTLLKGNAANVSTTLGGGANGYIGLVVTPAVYATIAPGTPFVRPIQPPAQPVMPAGSTAAVIANIVRVHEEEKRVWRECDNVEKALKKQLVDSIEALYLQAIRNRDNQYASVSLVDMLTFLFTAYGRLTAARLAENAKQLIEPWDPSTPLEALINRFEDCQDVAEAGNDPMTERTLVNSAFALVFNTGLYFQDCRDWERRPAAEHTWVNFKMYFLEAQRNLRQQQGTTQSQGYHGANAMLDQENYMHTAEALANLATAATSDRQAFHFLAEANAAQTTTIQSLTVELKQLREQLATLLKEPKQGTRRQSTYQPNENYCWTHGYKVAASHTSETCKSKALGHKNNATRANIMGGSTRGKE